MPPHCPLPHLDAMVSSLARQQLPSRHFLYHNPRPDYEFGPSLSLIFPQMPQATPVSRAQESHPDCRLPEVTGTDCSPPCGHIGVPNNHGTRILQKQQPQKHKNADQQSMTDGDPGGVVLLRCCEGPNRQGPPGAKTAHSLL